MYQVNASPKLTSFLHFIHIKSNFWIGYFGRYMETKKCPEKYLECAVDYRKMELFDRLDDADKWPGSIGRHSHFYSAQAGLQCGLEDFSCFWKVKKGGVVLLLHNMV